MTVELSHFDSNTMEKQRKKRLKKWM